MKGADLFRPGALPALREKLGISPEQLAALVGVTVLEVRTWEAKGIKSVHPLILSLLELLLDGAGRRERQGARSWAVQLISVCETDPLRAVDLLLLERRRPLRLRLVPLGAGAARLELHRGGRRLDIVGTRRGSTWELDPLHARALERVIPLLEERARAGAGRWQPILEGARSA